MRRRKDCKKLFVVFAISTLLIHPWSSFGQKSNAKIEKSTPKIVNIINFVRFCEPRVPEITEDVLFQTVVNQVEMMKKYHLKGTFLLQYDALKDSRYQKLFKSLPDSMVEVGGWWEIPQPLVEDAGMTWHGRYPWDWHANVGFSTGYAPAERLKLVDTYMKTFKEVFGHYPKSIGCWYIDSRSLNYMAKKYGIQSSCICRDQIGTDGYTLWGGYWNQGYYPSIKNTYMPAQSQSGQISVPVFRMLGSDPVRQYDSGIGSEMQGVATMEPVSSNEGGNANWVKWYFDQFTKGACMKYNYVQIGQENSFTWANIRNGFEIQMPLVAKLRDEGKVQIQTLGETGAWFVKNFKTTPATSVSVLKDIKGSDSKTIWFDSRYFRANILWDNGSIRFRDIHLFDENFASDYYNAPGTSSSCFFYTLPFIDGHLWSSSDKMAGLRLMATVNGQEVEIKGKVPVFDDSKDGVLRISWPLTSINGDLVIVLDEKKVTMWVESATQVKWSLNLTTTKDAQLPFSNIKEGKVDCVFKGFKYAVLAESGSFKGPDAVNALRIQPKNNIITLNFSERIKAKGK